MLFLCLALAPSMAITGKHASDTVQQAEQQLQQGERRQGCDAVGHYSRSVDFFHQAFRAGLPPPDRQNALVLCSAALQQWAQQVLQTEATLPDEEQSAEVEAAAKATAIHLLERAAQVRLIFLSSSFLVTNLTSCLTRRILRCLQT
jgi:hypothetical protein